MYLRETGKVNSNIDAVLLAAYVNINAMRM